MTSILRASLIVLVLPFLAWLLAEASLGKAEVSWREGLRRTHPELAPAQLAARPVPDRYARVQRVRNVAAATGALGLALVAGIGWAGRATRNRRDLLLRLFRPGLYVTLALVALLTAAQGVGLAFALYYFEAIYFQRVHFIVVLGVAIGGVLAFFAVLAAMFTMLRKAEFRVPGRRVSASEQPQLWTLVGEVCQRLQTRRPDHLVLGLEPAFYVTESEAIVGAERLEGRTLHLSLSFCRLLTRPELKAIIGHEMAHFIGADTVFSRQFFPVYRATCAALLKLGGDAGYASVALVRMPALSLLGFFLDAFATSEKNLSRQRELEADAVGVAVAGSQALAAALVKVYACAPAWRDLLKGVHYRAEEFRAVDNLAACFAQRASRLSPEIYAKLAEKQVPHPIDSHPPLASRLEALSADFEAVARAVARPAPDEPASTLIVDVEALELTLSAELKHALAK